MLKTRKSKQGYNAHLLTNGEIPILTVFTPNAQPFDQNRGYNPVQIYTIINFGSLSAEVYSKTAKKLLKDGFGTMNESDPDGVNHLHDNIYVCGILKLTKNKQGLSLSGFYRDGVLKLLHEAGYRKMYTLDEYNISKTDYFLIQVEEGNIIHEVIPEEIEDYHWHRNTIAKVLNGDLINIQIMTCLIEEAKKTIKVNQEIESLLQNMNNRP